MALHAKPRGAYAIGSVEWNENIAALWGFCRGQGFSEAAFSGMMGNAQNEGGMNPWRWQGDTVRYSGGYGLFQYTPARGYINNYGPGLSYYAPNLSVSGTTSGAQPTDAYAQILAIDASGKYFGGGTRDRLLAPYVSDYANYKTIAGFKTCTDVQKSTYLWLGYFEVPAWWIKQSNVSTNAGRRLDAAEAVYRTIKGTSPPAPGQDDPDRPQPTPGNFDLFEYGGIRDVLRRLIIHA